MQLVANIQLGEALSLEDLKMIEAYAEKHALSFDQAATSILKKGIRDYESSPEREEEEAGV